MSLPTLTKTAQDHLDHLLQLATEREALAEQAWDCTRYYLDHLMGAADDPRVQLATVQLIAAEANWEAAAAHVKSLRQRGATMR